MSSAQAKKTTRGSEHEHRQVRGTLDFHRSPPEAVTTFLRVEGRAVRRYAALHEMACGDGALVLPLRAAGLNVVASDIRDRGCPRAHCHDYLGARRPRFRLPVREERAGFTNPPFNCADAFIMRATEECDYVAMLLRTRYLAGKHRVQGVPIWRATRINCARIIMTDGRLPMMHRAGYRGTKTKSGFIDFSLFIWERGHVGPPQIIRAEDYA